MITSTFFLGVSSHLYSNVALFVVVLVRFIAMTLLNLWVLLTVFYYQRHSGRSKKKDWALQWDTRADATLSGCLSVYWITDGLTTVMSATYKYKYWLIKCPFSIFTSVLNPHAFITFPWLRYPQQKTNVFPYCIRKNVLFHREAEATSIWNLSTQVKQYCFEHLL